MTITLKQVGYNMILEATYGKFTKVVKSKQDRVDITNWFKSDYDLDGLVDYFKTGIKLTFQDRVTKLTEIKDELNELIKSRPK